MQTLTRLQNEGFDASALIGDDQRDPSAAAGAQVVGEMFEYFTAAIADARQRPGDDLLGSPRGRGDRRASGSATGTSSGSASWSSPAAQTPPPGSSRTPCLLTGQQMDQREAVLADPSLLPGALVECLRYESSVQALARTTTEDVEVDGVRIPAGEKVLMLYGSANRDPREYGETADRLDVRREVSRHLAFSSGPHFCIGNHLARLQAQVAVEELFAAHPHVTVDPEAGERHESAFVRGWVSLPAHGLAGSRRLLLPVQEGRHRLARLVGAEQPRAQRGHLLGLRVDVRRPGRGPAAPWSRAGPGGAPCVSSAQTSATASSSSLGRAPPG